MCKWGGLLQCWCFSMSKCVELFFDRVGMRQARPLIPRIFKGISGILRQQQSNHGRL